MILASSSSTTVFTISPSSSATKTRRYIPKTPQSPFLFKRNRNPTSLPFPPSTRSTKLCSVQATVLKENEDEKVVAEESFRPSTFTHGPEASPQPSPPTELDKWVVKLEQSVNVFLTDSVVTILDALYHDRDYARFYVLETIARVPYFAFISVLHLYESFGWWRRSDYIKVHFAESWNEMHHLLIMEDLGGNSWWP
ncbi:hypothetical protein OIU78_000035 [Salix suchowensis]|nr:hypothetical protein OIU78_000035 [Salix suchowensis]